LGPPSLLTSPHPLLSTSLGPYLALREEMNTS
jgi:hypothetical protein